MDERVDIIYKSLPAYRLEFFDGLRDALAADGTTLRLFVGQPSGEDVFKNDSRLLPWAENVPSRVWKVPGTRRQALWQPLLRATAASDLVIVEQASKLLINYPLLLGSNLSGPRTALWGHGGNLQIHTASRLSESLKRRYSRLAHWWFAYTEGTKRRVEDLGYPANRITVVQNSIDTIGLRRRIDDVHPEDAESLSLQLSLTSGNTALFLGSLWEEKRLPLLLAIGDLCYRSNPHFRLIIAGDGPLRGYVEHEAARREHVHYLGRVDGDERALLLHVSDLALMPGLVGLGILDAFAARIPLVTTAIGYHSPEIEYLVDGVNGRLLPDAPPHQLAAQMLALMANPDEMEKLRRGAAECGSRITTEAMVDNFVGGVRAALAASRRQAWRHPSEAQS